MFSFIRQIACRIDCICFVLIRLKVIDDRVRICFVLFTRKFVAQPGRGLLVFPAFYQVVTQVPDSLAAGQGLSVRLFSCCFVAVFVSTNNFGSLFWVREALDTAMPVATMKLEDSFGFGMIAINRELFDESFTSVTTFVMMDVLARLLRYVL